MREQEFIEEPRSLSEIVESIEEFIDKVWYNRHQVRREQIELGKIKIVEKETFPIKNHAKRPITRRQIPRLMECLVVMAMLGLPNGVGFSF